VATPPKISAIDGAPHSTSPGRPTTSATGAARGRNGRPARPPNTRVEQNSCPSAGVVSCENCASPSVAISASRPPSASARA
jgi:hypothetical protein